jgi:hypothetical protein
MSNPFHPRLNHSVLTISITLRMTIMKVLAVLTVCVLLHPVSSVLSIQTTAVISLILPCIRRHKSTWYYRKSTVRGAHNSAFVITWHHNSFTYDTRFEALISALMRIQVSWGMTSSRLVSNYRRFGDASCLHFQALHRNLKFLRNVGHITTLHGVIPRGIKSAGLYDIKINQVSSHKRFTAYLNFVKFPLNPH